ncbi:MAG: hypothetical protein MUP85_12220, partial [Candidatus Lokiarchaeota archaeon]|nr:hypothetical protein [Candidatus Lokiarchaeota archaeon]
SLLQLSISKTFEMLVMIFQIFSDFNIKLKSGKFLFFILLIKNTKLEDKPQPSFDYFMRIDHNS